MRRPFIPTVLLSAALVAACSEQPTIYELPVSVAAHAKGATPTNYGAHLTGDAERPVPRETRAQGQIKLQLSKDGETLYYKLIAANIENVFMAHLHLGPADDTGGIVVWLYPEAPPAGPQTLIAEQNGVLAEGEITEDDLVGALADGTMADLVAAIEAGMIYANVHTNDFVDPANTGPGDFPGGEIRGQL